MSLTVVLIKSALNILVNQRKCSEPNKHCFCLCSNSDNGSKIHIFSDSDPKSGDFVDGKINGDSISNDDIKKDTDKIVITKAATQSIREPAYQIVRMMIMLMIMHSSQKNLDV